MRKATLEDLDFLEQLEKVSFAPNRQSDRRSLRASIASDAQIVFVLEQTVGKKRRPVGSAIIFCYRLSLRIYSVAVLPDRRGQGVGEFFLGQLIDFAAVRGFEKLTLEADCENEKLVQWYEKHGFKTVQKIDHYYGKNEPALRMAKLLYDSQDSRFSSNNVIVIKNPKQWTPGIPDVEVVSAKEYLSAERFLNSERYRVLNLCNTYRTHTLGYYVSLLASARNHQIVPSVMTLKDFTNISIAQSLVNEIEDFVQETLASVEGNLFEMPVIFGGTPDKKYALFAKKLFKLLEFPFFKISFEKHKTWRVRRLTHLHLDYVAKNYPEELEKRLTAHFQKRRHYRAQLKQYKYDLAILIDPDEKTPPSSRAALDKFKEAAQEVGFMVEFITKLEYRSICEFDALFIRETTAIENHTYKFARHAYTEGLIVIDDPWSILRCSNKIYLYERLARRRIKQPKSWLLTKGAVNQAVINSLVFPLVLKMPEGAFSLGVFRVDNVKDFLAKLEIMFEKSDLVIAQEFLRSDFDWRIGVLDNTPLFACKYYMANGHWQIYNWAMAEETDDFAGNSDAIPVNQVPPHILSAAVQASSVIGNGLYGVDLKDINGKPYVIEVNDNPNIDVDIEDKVLKDELYLRVMRSFFNRIEMERNQPRYLI
jgi:glutathione synthase/RimK-type ligase-like ATP-grasp enzyme/ribosomal protein S18 acetylase RimI-like enzyme